MGVTRKPAVAGYFYPGNKEELEKTIGSFENKSNIAYAAKEDQEATKGVVLPHAGYMYSGAVAAQTVFASKLENILIIIGPNHTGLGELFSVMTEGSWQTPLGNIDIESKLAKDLVNDSQLLVTDDLAHLNEHSIEVLLPFLMWVNKKCTIVPIIVSKATVEVYKQIGNEIFEVLEHNQLTAKISIVASSDMTHYESADSAKEKDHYAIDSIVKLDPDELMCRVNERKISMCGVGPVTIMLAIVKRMGAHRAQLINYQTSGDVTGDFSSVVGYAGIKIN